MAKISYVLLNVIRALNIISLLACMIAAGALMAKTSDLKVSKFNFFDAVEKALIILFCIFLLLSEAPRILHAYFEDNWPTLSHTSGFFTFSLALLYVGVDVLSWLTKEKTDEAHLGDDFYRLVLAAGGMTILMSLFNVIASLFCGDRRSGMTARQVRSHQGDRDEVRNDVVDMPEIDEQ